MNSTNFNKKFFYIFLFIYLIIGLCLSLNVGITHDESHNYFVWELNKDKIFNLIFGSNFNVSSLNSYHGFYGVGFYFFSETIGVLTNTILKFFINFDTSNILLGKHTSVFLFFFISGLYFKKIIYLITRDIRFSYLSTIFYFFYPYLLGHSLFNVKDVPFMSVWLVCTYLLIDILKNYLKKNEIKLTKIILISFLTAYLFSIRISGILIFLQYFIFLFIFLTVFKLNFADFAKKIYKKIIQFLIFFLFFLYIFYPNFWDKSLNLINALLFMSQHVQTVCTITLGECMKAQNLPSSYLPIWLFFKLPILIILGFILFPFCEKKIFSNKNNAFIIGSLLATVLLIIFLLILFNVNLYDELRQVLFLMPLIFIISLSTFYYYSKKISFTLLIVFSIFFFFQNIKIFPYNYIWLNNLTHFTKINGVFELDYWGVSTKNISTFLDSENIRENNCIISNRNDGLKAFNRNKKWCFKSFNNLHKKNERPFYVILLERAVKKGTPSNCRIKHQEEVSVNFSKEKLILAKVFICN